MAKKKTDYETTKPKYLSFWSILFVLSVVGLFIMLRKFVCFHGDMLFWFLASTSQSMAALFAVGGLFAVFRFQAQEAKLRNLYDVFKEWIMEDGRYGYFDERPVFWIDNQIVSSGRKAVKKHRDRINKEKNKKGDKNVHLKKQEKDITSIEERIDDMDCHERIRKVALKGVKLPMLVILITFMISIGSLPFTSYISKNWLGLMILTITLALITFSLMSVYTFIRFSLSFKEEASKSDNPN